MGAGCAVCGARNWNIEQELLFLGLLDPEYKQPVEGRLLPLVAVNCAQCYQVVFFQAMALGLL